jgi:hypothetical protein
MIEDMHLYWGEIEANVVLQGQAELAEIFTRASRKLYQSRDAFYGLRQVDGHLAADPEDLVKASRILEGLQGEVETFLVGPGQKWAKDRMPKLLKAGRELARQNFVDVRSINQDLVKAAFQHVSTAEKGVLKVGFQDQYKILNTVGDDVGEWFRRTLMDSMVEGIPIEAPLGTDSLFNRLYESGRLKPQTIRAKDGRLIHRSLEQRAQAIARVENNKVINRVHEVVGEEALGGEGLWKDAGPIDGDTTNICLDASLQAPMTRQEWAQSPWGLAPRIDRDFHLCRHFMLGVKKEWEDSKVVAARDRAIGKEKKRREAEEKKKPAQPRKKPAAAKPRKKAAAPPQAKPPAAQPAPAFVPAQNTQEAEKFALDRKLASHVSYKGMSLELANETNKQLDKFNRLFGVTVDHIGPQAKIVKELTGRKRAPGGVVMAHWEIETLSTGKVTTALSFNPKATSAKSLESTFRNMGKSLTKGMDLPGLPTHEIGHAVDQLTGKKAGGLWQAWKGQFPNGQEGQLRRVAIEKELKKEIGTYAFSKPSEFFAECFRLHYTGRLPAQMSFLGDMIKKMEKRGN